MRQAILTTLVLVLGAAPISAQGWAEKMFKVNNQALTHNFGNVPHGAQLFHRFTITNIYAVRMEITGIKPGCGCVTAVAAKRVLEPREATTIDVSMDARRFTGAKTVGIRVTVGSEEYGSSAELHVTANSRADVVFNPGQVSFGPVTRGTQPNQVIDVDYAGMLDWKVTEVIARDTPYDVSLVRKPAVMTGQIGYRVTVTMKSDAPVGVLKHQIFLKTNDPASPLVPILVEATVQTALTVVPPNLNLGTVPKNAPVTRQVVVRGSKPFRILSVEGTGNGVTLAAEPAVLAAPVQALRFRYQPTQAGPFKRVLKVLTDLQEAPVLVTLEGTVAP